MSRDLDLESDHMAYRRASLNYLYYQISLRQDEKIYRQSHLNFLPSSKLRDKKTRRDIKTTARSILDIFL